MLILTRKVGEKIVIGDGDIVFEILNNKNGQVRVGISAPDHVSIHREEIFNRIKNSEKATGVERVISR